MGLQYRCTARGSGGEGECWTLELVEPHAAQQAGYMWICHLKEWGLKGLREPPRSVWVKLGDLCRPPKTYPLNSLSSPFLIVHPHRRVPILNGADLRLIPITP